MCGQRTGDTLCSLNLLPGSLEHGFYLGNVLEAEFLVFKITDI